MTDSDQSKIPGAYYNVQFNSLNNVTHDLGKRWENMKHNISWVLSKVK